MGTSSAIPLAFCLVFAFLANYGAADARCNYTRNYIKGSLTEKNLQMVLGELLDSSSQPAAYKTSYAPAATAGGGVGQNSSAATAIYGLLQCYAGTSSSQCNQCAQEAVISTPASCPNATAAMAWLDNCFLRFDNSNFTGVLDTNDFWYMYNGYNVPDDGAVFDKAAHQLLNNLITEALQPSSPSYAFGSNVSEHTRIYGLVQCWRDILVDDCRSCLFYSLGLLQDSVKGKQGARTMGGSCYVRYEIYPFITATTPPPAPLHAPHPLPATPPPPAPLHAPPPWPKTPQLPTPALSSDGSNKHLSKLAVIISATVGSLIVVLLLLGCGFLAYKSRRRPALETGVMKETPDNLENDYEMTMFNMETLNAATNNFDENLKVGEGGCGAVYRVI